MTKADEASTSKREKDVEMGGSGSHGHGDSTCTETQWVEYIEKKLDENRVSRQAGIAKVPKFCRDINEAYKPCIISIGPFHRGNSETEPMEQHKWQCLNYILSRKSISYLKECFKVLKKLEVDARCSYLDDFQLDSMYFMEMMLLDGCFIVDYLRQSSNIPFIKPWMKPQIDNDRSQGGRPTWWKHQFERSRIKVQDGNSSNEKKNSDLKILKLESLLKVLTSQASEQGKCAALERQSRNKARRIPRPHGRPREWVPHALDIWSPLMCTIFPVFLRAANL